jgi:ferredoxin--NADP+ reductase
MRSDALPHQLGLEAMNPARDRMMLCGSPAMLGEMEALLIERGFVEGNHSEAGHYVLEKAFVQR